MSTPPTFRGGRARRGRATRAAAATVVLLLAACGSAHKAGTAEGTTTTTLDAEAQAVLTGWRAAQQAFIAAEENPQGAYSPALAATMADPELTQVRRQLLGNEHTGYVGQGSVRLGNPRVTVQGTEATVSSCIYDGLILIQQATGKPAPGDLGKATNALIRSTMVLGGSGSLAVWKESSAVVQEGSCSD